MKKRLSRVLNFFAFNLLFFALYLNFIHKDNNDLPAVSHKSATMAQGTTLVLNPEQYVQTNAAFAQKTSDAIAKQ